MHRIALVVLLFGLNTFSYAQSIVVNSISPTATCAGANVTVTFSTTNGTSSSYYNNSTTYQAYISDATGNNFVAIPGTFTLLAAYSTADNGVTNSLVQNITIPASLVSGAGYKISIGSTSPTFNASAGAGASSAFSATGTLAVGITSSVTGNTLCSGTSVTFTSTVTNGGTNPTYQWFVNNSPVSGATSSTYVTSTLAQGDLVKLEVTRNAPCASPTTLTSNTLTMTVNPVLVPTVAIQSNAAANTVCIGGSITFSISTVTNGGLSPTYQWFVNNSPSENASTFTTTTLANGDVIKLTLTSNATCASPTAVTSNNITVTVTPNAAITLSSAAGTSNQSVCAGVSITPITYTVGGSGNGATVSGLPAGVSGSYSGGVLTITGTPSASGTFNYSVTATGTCLSATATGTISVNPNAVITLTSAAGTNTQTVCATSPIVNVTYAISGGSTGASVSGLPSGITGSFSGGIFTITGSTPTAGVHNYTVTSTGGTCAQTTATGTITVNPNAAITLSSAPGTNSQTVCANSPIVNISYAITGGGTGATVSALPAGLSGSFSAGTFTITGTPTAAGTTSYTVTSTGSCAQVTATGTITVNPNAAIALLSVTGTTTQTVCANSAIVNITYNITGGGTGATATNLPAGLTGTFSGGVFTIAGSPTVTGLFNYTVTTTGTCVQATASGSVTVNPNATITLSSAAGTNTQTVCANSPIVNITYAIAGGGSGATVSGLTAGLTGNFSAGVFTISGTPTTAGTVNYTITTTGNCLQSSATGTINTNPIGIITLTSANNTQTRCINNAIANITYTLSGGATGASVTGLPTGVTGTTSGTIFTISGTPTVAGAFNYTITTSGGSCTQASATGAITVNGNTAIALTSASTTVTQNVCRNSAITNIVYTLTNATGYTISPALPAGLTAVLTSGTLTISGTANSAASTTPYAYTVTSTGLCSSPTSSFSIQIWSGTPDNSGSNNGKLITGPTSICPGALATGLTFTAPTNLIGSTQLYTWIVPGGFTIISGQGTSQITVSVPGPGATVGTNTLQVTASNPCGSPVTVSYTVNIASFNAISLGSDVAICAGSITLTNVLSGGSQKVYWATPSVGTITGGPYPASYVYTPPALFSGVVTLRANTDTAVGNCNAAAAFGTAQVNITVSQPVAITTQPVGQSVCSGTSVSFSVTATGTGPTYQWRKGGVNISGATAATFTIANPVVADAGTYSVVVSGTSPCASVTSADAILNVSQLISISTQPLASQTICSGSNVSFSVTTTASGFTYQWRRGATNLTNGGNISGANSSTLTITSASSSDAATDYNVVITGAAPCAPVTSNNASLIVNQAVNITTQPAGTQTICSGSTVSFTVVATGTGVTYQWRKGTTNLVNGGNISGATSAILTITNAVVGDIGTYSVTVSGTAPCSSVTSTDAVLNINQLVTITTQPLASQTVCSGTTVTLSVSTTATIGITFQWRKGTTNLTNTGNISGATTNTLTISSVTTSDAATDYNVLITSSSPCVPVTSTNASLIVNQVVTIGTQPAATQTICSGSTATFMVAATGTGLTYQWRKGTANLVDAGNISGATTATLTITNAVMADAGTYTVLITGTAPCAGVTSSNAILNVNQIINITAQPTASQTVCSGAAVSFSVVATPATGLTYQWRKGTTNLSNGGTISGVNTNTLSISSTVAADAGTDYNVIVTSVAPCNPVTSSNASLIVNNAVVIGTQPAATQSTCSGSTVSFSVAATGTGLSYKWRKGSTDLVDGGNISGATTSTLTITNTLVGDAGTYSVVVSGTSPCAAITSSNAVLTVNRNVTISTQPVNVGICASSPAQLGAVASGDGLTYQWYKGSFPGTPVVNSSTITGAQSSVLSFSQAFVADAGVYYLQVSGISPCASVRTNEVTLNVSQSIVVTTQPSNTSICQNGTTSFSVVASAGSDVLTYQWRKGTTNLANSGAVSGVTTSTLTISNVQPSDAGSDYNVVISGSASYTCPSITSTNTTLTVNTAPFITMHVSGAAQSVCLNGTTNPLSVNATGTNLIYQWFSNTTNSNTDGNSITGATNASFTPPSTTAGTLFYYVVVSGTCSPSVNSTISGGITINASTTITTQPAITTQTVCQNLATTSLTVVASGVGLSYQWYSNTANSNSGGTLITGATSSSYLPPSNVAGTFYYYVIVGSTCNAVTSTVSGAIIVNPSPFITTQPSATAQNVCINSTSTSLSVIAGGTGAAYQWYRNTSASNTGSTLLAGANANSYTPATNLLNTSYYYVVVSGTCAPTVTSTVSGAITVSDSARGGSLSPSLIGAMCKGLNNGTFNLSGQFGSIVKWQRSINGFASWDDIANTTSSISFTNIDTTTSYRAVIQNGACSEVFSAVAVAAVIPPFYPVVSSVPGSFIICIGDSVKLVASGFTSATPTQFGGGDFNTANPKDWRVTANGVEIVFPANGDNSDQQPFSETNGPKTFFGNTANEITYNNTPVTDGKFAIVNGIIKSTLETPIFSLVGRTSANLNFFQAYKFSPGTIARIEISTNGGVTYTGLLVAYNPPATFGVTNGGFVNTNVTLNAYLGLSNLRIRFNYDSPSGASSWGIDNVTIAPSPFVPTVYQWSGPGVNTAAQTITVTPPVGTHVYNLTSQTGTCSFVTTQVTVIVNGRPSIALLDTALKACLNPGAQTVNLPYGSPIYTPTNYNITWSASPTNTFVPITGAALPGSAVTINVPAGTAPGLYSGTIFVTNSNGCNGPGKPFTVRVVAAPTIVLAPISPTSCVGEPTFIPSGATSTEFGYQWEVSTDGGNNYTTIANGTVYADATTATLKVLSPTIAMIDYLYRLKATATDPCNNIVTSVGVKIKLRNVWLGTVSTDWQVGANWSDGNVASIICDDVHVLNRPNQARLTYGISTITNLIVYPSAFLTIDNALMQIRGTMTNSNNTGTILARRGSIELNGTFGVAQIIPATIFQNNALLNLILDNPSGVNVAGDLDIYRSVKYEGTGRIIYTNDFLTLKSNPEETAWLGTTTGNSIVGKVTIERHMYPIKSWRLMATPVDISTSPSIFNSWQEGTTSFASTGFGTQITGPGAPAGGLDIYTQRGSLKYFDPNIQDYVEMTSTAGPIARTTGYYVFVRGDRSVPIFGAAGATNLRIKGKVNTGPQTFGVLSNRFACVGNPYPSRVNVQAVLNTTVVQAFTTWNPNFAGLYGVGAFQTFVRELSPPYNYRLNGLSTGLILNHIESGQAIFVQSIPGGTITVNESDKIDGSALYSRNLVDGENIIVPTLEISMHTKNPDGSEFVADGTIINFDDSYAAGIDNLDARKITNAVDNFSVRNNQSDLSADRRPTLKATDTLHFSLTNTRNANYRLEIIPFLMGNADLKA